MDTIGGGRNVLNTKANFIRMTAPVGNEVSSREHAGCSDAVHQNDYAISFRSCPSHLYLTHSLPLIHPFGVVLCSPRFVDFVLFDDAKRLPKITERKK